MDGNNDYGRDMKHEFSKIVLAIVIIIWIAGAIFGGIIVYLDHYGLEALFTYIGAPTATAVGFYAWKAKAENVIKISKDKKIDEKTKKQIVSSIAGAISDIETE